MYLLLDHPLQSKSLCVLTSSFILLFCRSIRHFIFIFFLLVLSRVLFSSKPVSISNSLKIFLLCCSLFWLLRFVFYFLFHSISIFLLSWMVWSRYIFRDSTISSQSAFEENTFDMLKDVLQFKQVIWTASSDFKIPFPAVMICPTWDSSILAIHRYCTLKTFVVFCFVLCFVRLVGLVWFVLTETGFEICCLE